MAEYLQQIQRGIDYIEARLEQSIELRAVSKAAGISHAHFQRIFKALTGETLKTYVRARRMANALDLLLATDLRILDVALAAGFESQEAFARAFKKAFGLTPTAYRQLGNGNLFLKKLRIDQSYLEHVSAGVSLQPALEHRSETSVVGMRTVLYGAGTEKNNVAQRLPPLWARYLERAHEIDSRQGATYYGVLRQDVEDPERLEYFAAVGAPPGSAVPAGMDRTDIAAGRYAVFEHRGPTARLDQTVDYIYATWLARSSERHTWGADLELYGAQWRGESPESVMHYAIPLQ